MATGIARLEELTWTAVRDLPPERAVVLILSSPIEQHGPHLPLGSDLFQAALVRDRIAERLASAGRPVVIAPTIPYSTAVLSRTYPGSVSVRARHLVPFFTDVLNSFATNGLRSIVVVSQHIDPPHVLAWEEACRRAAGESGARAIEGYERLLFDDLRDDAIAPLLGASSCGDSHAGLFETSVMMLARPHLVDADLARRLPPAHADFDAELRAARDFHEIGEGLGYTGDPARANREIGRRLVEHYARKFGDLVEQHLEGADVWERLSIRHLFGG